jgi:sporulation-control protein spo0M
MSTALPFPGPEVREEMHCTIGQYAAGELSRLQMGCSCIYRKEVQDEKIDKGSRGVAVD